ncbi:NAD-dependent epimerase/dehydratase family protein [Nocardioides flavescens]|uniref:Epimerase n=1 Tax=Nocardioides flavescens TaxID=2691959 RepID=A0A6L7EUX8_9ACTN|nr:NAD-dependent epimerase/dehydratase family protein [Nocardioides flavescens]MXG91173.1 epimerase [Nocardioides flavescens]
MRLLVLGGTVFLSRAVADAALARGHEVVCAARGTSGSVPEGARLVEVDRAADLPDLGGPFDAVVDVARQPSWVRRALAATDGAHWVFVSTISVYADESTPGGGPGSLPLVPPVVDDTDLEAEPSAYGGLKVECERLVREGATSATVLRPGLIVGPGDPTGRFSYWPRRLADGGEVLAPGAPDDSVQVIDVRDLASWVVHCAEERVVDTLDAVGRSLPFADLLAQCADGVGSSVALTWVPQEHLIDHSVEPWAGPGSLPLWLPRPAYDGMLAHDVAPALAAGLQLRPLAETARDTLAWLRDTPDAVVTGIDRAREAALLGSWGARTGR